MGQGLLWICGGSGLPELQAKRHRWLMSTRGEEATLTTELVSGSGETTVLVRNSLDNFLTDGCSLMSACISWWEKLGFFVFLNTHAQMWSDEFDVCNLRFILAVRDPSLMLLKWKKQETKSTLPVLCKMQAKCLAEESRRLQQCNSSKSSLQCYSL